MKILLDSNAYTLFTKGNDAITELVRNADEVLMSVVVVGELQYGFRFGTRLGENLATLERFLKRRGVFLAPIGYLTASFYGQIAASLRTIGRPIPTNDMWIAAHAFETGAELVSADRDFEVVEGLMWQRISAT